MKAAHLKVLLLALFALYLALLTGCSSDDGPAPFVLDVPKNFPPPRLPADNPLNAAKITLGRFLFYDRNMSFNQTQSCGDCHQQDRAFTDGLVTSVGSRGDIHPRNAMSMTNVIYNGTQNWANNAIVGLDEQALAVFLNENPVELGWTNHEDEIMDRFRVVHAGTAAGDIDYPALFAAAFPGEGEPYTMFNFAKAVAAFGTMMISGNSEYDKYLRDEPHTMSDAALRGKELFFTERLDCFHCHAGFHFSDNVDHASLQFTQHTFHNNALYNIGGDGSYPDDNKGLIEVTLKPSDEGRFRPATLRNIELTAPYMHDGSIATLDEVIDHYAAGGRTIDPPDPNAGVGADNPNKSGFVSGFFISAGERLDLIAFFGSLTDWEFVCREDLSDPFGNIPLHPNCP